MKKINYWLSAALIVSILAPVAAFGQVKVPVGMKQIGNINFNNYRAGSLYNLEMMKADWNPRLRNGDDPIDFKGIIHQRAKVMDNSVFGGNALRIFLPKEKISPLNTGAQIFGYLGGQEELYFSTDLFLPNNFECGREMKIPPGIYGGWKFATGGQIPDGVKVGPSIRAVLQECQAKSYVYYLDQTGNNGDGGFYRNSIYGDKFPWRHANGRPVIVSKGVKHEITFFAKMNNPGRKDGTHQVWYDGELVLNAASLEFRKAPTLKFDTVGMEIFRGGNDQSYATLHDNSLDVSNFQVYVKGK